MKIQKHWGKFSLTESIRNLLSLEIVMYRNGLLLKPPKAVFQPGSFLIPQTSTVLDQEFHFNITYHGQLVTAHNVLNFSLRLTGFYLGVIILICLIILGTAGAAGIVNIFLDEYLDFNIMEKVHKLL